MGKYFNWSQCLWAKFEHIGDVTCHWKAEQTKIMVRTNH